MFDFYCQCDSKLCAESGTPLVLLWTWLHWESKRWRWGRWNKANTHKHKQCKQNYKQVLYGTLRYPFQIKWFVFHNDSLTILLSTHSLYFGYNLVHTSWVSSHTRSFSLYGSTSKPKMSCLRSSMYSSTDLGTLPTFFIGPKSQ